MLNEVKNNNDKIEYLMNDVSYIPDDPNLIVNCAELAADVYNDSGCTVEGWQRYAQIKTDSGYFGAIYLGPVYKDRFGDQIRDFVFAHRGTSSILDLIADISVVRERPFQQIYDAANFVYEISQKIGKNKPDPLSDYGNTYHTGHSLGAILSDICSCFNVKKGQFLYKSGLSITFENPGSKNIAINAYPELIKKFNDPDSNAKDMLGWMKSCCTAFQSPINIINSCNEQAGTTYRLIDKPHHIDPDYAKSQVTNPFSISAKWEGNLIAYAKLNTMDQHLISPIVDYLKANGRTVIENNPAFDLQPAYKEFLNYDTNKPYWDAYFEAIYVVSGRNDREQFFKYALDALKSAHDYTIMMIDNPDFVIIPKTLEKQSMFATKLNDVVPTPYNDVVPTPYNDEVPTPYETKRCSIM